KRLWEHPPLGDAKKDWLIPREQPGKSEDDLVYARIESIAGRQYAPVVARDLGAALDIVLLRQQARGQLIAEGGDIDNRLKTLFDALIMSSTCEVQQLGTETAADEAPLHCLLKDDSLIHRVNVETDRLLRDAKPFDLIAIINVTIVVTKVTWGTL